MTIQAAPPGIVRFRAPLEEPAPTLLELAWRARPGWDRGDVERVVRGGGARVDGIAWRRPERAPDPGDPVEIDFGDRASAYGIPDAIELARASDWVIVEKPVGMPVTLDRSDPMNPVLFLADSLGLDRDAIEPVYDLPENAGGAWLLATDAAAAERLRSQMTSGSIAIVVTAICERLERPTGALDVPRAASLAYGVTRFIGSLCEVQLTLDELDARGARDPIGRACEALAMANRPAIGDVARGAILAPGPLRARVSSIYGTETELAHSWPTPRTDWMPDPSIVPGAEEAERLEEEREDRGRAAASGRRGLASLRVSSKTLEVMAAGHPWALEDARTESRDRFEPGEVVRLRDGKGRMGPVALVDGPGSIAARYWSEDEELASGRAFEEEVRARVDEAIARRAPLWTDPQTDLFRVIHADADGLPGLIVDRVGGLYRALWTGQTARGFAQIAYDQLAAYDDKLTLLELDHTEDVRRRTGALPRARAVRGAHIVRWGAPIIGREEGLRYWCEPWEGIDTGFFADQRENRRLLAASAAPGQEWLNLFGHTGAFSVALAQRGARVTLVDVSRRYVDWAAKNFALNHIDPDLHRGACEDARSFVAGARRDSFDGIIVDPPTAAQGASSFWSVKRDLTDLLVGCFGALRPGAPMLVCRNRRGARSDLRELIERSASLAGHALRSIEPAPPAPDYPRVENFPEGDTFEGWIAC